jgi:subtilase family serine protease
VPQPVGSGTGVHVWHRSRLGVKKFGHLQTVNGLEAGALYRTNVQFRWYDASGKTIRKAKRTSGSCAENGELPNLTITAVKIASGRSAGTAVYSVAVANTGKGVARAFSVGLIVDGALSDSTTMDRLDGGETKTVKLTGPVCHRLRAVVDREDSLPETVEEDNSLRSRC